jgi:long-chain acyl-CoA synthetase
MHPSIHAQTEPNKPAYIIAETSQIVTYGELDSRSNQAAHLLRRAGLQTGAVVGIFMHNTAEYLQIAWAAQRCGLFYVCIPTRLTGPELRYLLRDSGAKALIFAASLANTVADASQGLDLELFSIEGAVPFAKRFETEVAKMPREAIHDEAPGQDLLYSSGTTGAPKGIELPRPTGGIAVPMPVTLLAQRLYGFSSETIYLSPAPLYHAAPLRFCMAVHQLGGTAIVMTKFDAETALKFIEKYRVSHAQWVPTHFVRMLKLTKERRMQYDLSSLTSTFHAAAPCPIPIKQQMIDWWGPIVHEYYSSTELNGFTAATAEEWLARKGTVGRAIIGKIRICDENGDVKGPRSEGDVYFEDGNPIKYRNAPAETRAATNSQGWTTVGDIGWVDEDDYLYLTDRQSFMIISGGVNIYPQEIEDLLISHPKVYDAAVVGAPDVDLGERVVAVVQSLEPSQDGPKLAQELLDYLRPSLSKTKLPRQIDFVGSLPREPTGKLFKRLVRDRYYE